MVKAGGKFPEEYADISLERLIEVFEAAPQRLTDVCADLSEEELRTRPDPDQWTIHQVVLHVSDAEIIGASRFRQCLAQPGSFFTMYNQDVWAQHCMYHNLDHLARAQAISMFESLRKMTALVLRQIPEIAWSKTGFHGQWGNVTLRQLLELYADHAERHIGQILRIRKFLGKPLDFPLLLDKKLYESKAIV